EPDTLEQRRRQVESLGAEELYELKRKWQRLEHLPYPDQQRVRQLHQGLEKAEDRAELATTLERYTDWLRSLPSARRAELLSQPADLRLDEIRSALEEQTTISVTANTALEERDFSVLKRWLNAYALKHKDELLQNMHADMRRRYDNATGQRQNILLAGALARDPQGTRRITDEELSALTTLLSPAAQQTLQRAPDRRQTLANWLRASTNFAFPPRAAMPTTIQLRSFYQTSVTDEQRKELESLSPEESKAMLLRLYRDAQAANRMRGGPRGPAAAAVVKQRVVNGPMPMRILPGQTIRAVTPQAAPAKPPAKQNSNPAAKKSPASAATDAATDRRRVEAESK
ncbi:MAG: hypothetical protein KDB14_14620, partial [Planctomycetales bacterium]|nr:hypothetical protein [Planctomycetales bacterium]